MNYSILVLSSPSSGGTVSRAARFTRALLQRGHSVQRVFFMDDGASAGNTHALFGQDEQSPAEEWQSLANEHALELILCVSSSLRRGVLDEGEAARHEKSGATTALPFTISGLGQLVDACASSERLITFGG